MPKYRTVTRVVVDVFGEFDADTDTEAREVAERDALGSVTVEPVRSEVEAAEWEVTEVTVQRGPSWEKV
jgi:hypothetical protein